MESFSTSSIQSIGGLPHDVGGDTTKTTQTASAIQHDPDSNSLQFWEQQCHALFALLASKGIVSTDALRRSIESLTPDQYETWTYYERWAAAMASLLLEEGVLTQEQLSTALFGSTGSTTTDESSEPATALFAPGDMVRIRNLPSATATSVVAWRRPHIRTPGYLFGVAGTIQDVCGPFGDPSYLAFGMEAPKVWLYRVNVAMRDIWPEQSNNGEDNRLSVEVYEHWLEESTVSKGHAYEDRSLFDHEGSEHEDCVAHHHHDHDDDGDHSHDPRPSVEERAIRMEGPPRPGQALHHALVHLLTTKSPRPIIELDELRQMMERMDAAGQDLVGADLVVEAWMDPEFASRLLANPADTARDELNIETANPNAPTVLTIVANTEKEHNLVVCTLCSCYPSSLLGIAPTWYKSREYRARAVRDPRAVLRDFGTTIDETSSGTETKKRIAVHDSTAEHRYLVLPQRPSGTEGWTKEQLRTLITRDSMIGVTLPQVE